MKYLSTSALAKEKNIDSKVLFAKLKEKGWIYKKDDQWQLTKEGRIAGGDMKYNPQYGEYIVWPENIDIEKTVKKDDTISSTDIGKQLNISAQKVNLIFAELGWIEKSEVGGWTITRQGEKNNGYELIAQNGAPYVIWAKSILENKYFVNSIKKAKGDYIEITSEEENIGGEIEDYRLKYPANYRTQDGHRVRSKSEALIDDYLYRAGIAHAYERKLPVEEDVISDFYIPSKKIYIEFWGLEEDAKYQDRKKRKLEIYSREGYNLIELTETDIQNIDDSLPRKLRKYGINID